MSDTSHSNDTDADLEARIRERAYHLWEADGCPHGRDLEYWERARELTGIEDNPQAGQLPNPIAEGRDPAMADVVVEESVIQQNLGEFPDRFSDQGDRQQTPLARPQRRADKAGATQ